MLCLFDESLFVAVFINSPNASDNFGVSNSIITLKLNLNETAKEPFIIGRVKIFCYVLKHLFPSVININ
jgi:hypothetical protein